VGGPAAERAAAHVFVADVAAPVLDDGDAHHLDRSLRLRAGEVVTVADGAGAWRRCRYRARGVLEPDGAIERSLRPTPGLTVAFALAKGDKPELVVQKLTELGVDVVVPVAAARSVVRWDDAKAAAQQERLQRVAREAAMQSRQVWIPTVGRLTTLASLVADVPALAVAEPGGAPPSLLRPAVAVGPEGGWSPDELALAPATMGLGPTVLRAEKAAIAAGVVLAALRAGILGENSHAE
jgi:16S rRNA (uracil1498-N3)-methyltransferase